MILLVEDDIELSSALSRLLAARGFQVLCSADGAEAMAIALSHRRQLDAILLDLSLPGMDGLEFLRRLRDASVDTPVLVVTARCGIEDRVVGLNLGADDYIGKPFDIREVEARLNVMVRRRRGAGGEHCGELRHDRASGQFFCRHLPLELSSREHALLKALIARAGNAIAKEDLLHTVFGAEHEGDADVIEVLVHRLRKRLGKSSVHIVTLRGVGYMLIDSASNAALD